MKRLPFPRLGSGFVLLLALLVLPESSLKAAPPVNIAIFPFTIHAEKDYDYLRAGIVDMLRSRLSYGNEVTVISKAETAAALENTLTALDNASARDIGQKLGADYVLTGSMTVFGASISMDIQMIDVHQQTPPLSFYKQSQGIDGVIPAVNQIAADINARIFGRTAPPPATAERAPQTAEATPEVDAVHAHPEKLLEGSADEDQTDHTLMAPSAAAAEPGPLPQPVMPFWKSRTYETSVNGLSVGDVDGDGRNETVMVTPDVLTIFKNEKGRFYKFKEIERSAFMRFIAVDVGDINANGVAEIFVTGLTTARTGADSSVYEYDGNDMRLLEEGTYWKYRVMRQEGNRLMLLAQALRPHQPNLGPVYAMIWNGNAYETDERVIALKTLDVLGMTFGDILNTGVNCFVANTTADRLRLITPGGEILWTSDEHYGGSSLYYSKGIAAPGELNNAYFPVRVIHADTNNDGINEVIAVKNYEIVNRVFQNFRVYADAHFESFTWDGLGLSANWKTRKFSGAVRDFTIADFDNDGQDELVAAVLVRDKHIVGMKPKSTIIAFELR